MKKIMERCGWILLVVFSCALLPSCISYDVTSPSDYIGPAQRAPAPSAGPGEEQPAPASRPAIAPTTGPLNVSVSDATLIALENNESLVVQRFNPELKRTGEMAARAVFDPDLTAAFSGSRKRDEPLDKLDSVTKGATAEMALKEYLPTGGTINLGVKTSLKDESGDVWTSRAEMTVTQSLLRGFGPEVNLASLRQARLDVLFSQYELRGFAQQLVSDTEQTYWDYVLAQRQIEIVEGSMKLAEGQLSDTDERIKVGKLSEVERAAAEATVAQRRQVLIVARNDFQTQRLKLLQLLNPPGPKLFDRQIIPRDIPAIPVLNLGPVAEHVQVGQRMRPDLNQSRLLVNKGELEVVKTRNGLLPKLDLFITMGKTGYAESFGPSANDVSVGPSYDLLVGGNFEYPPLNRAAQAKNINATLSLEQALDSVKNLSQTVEVDVRTVYVSTSSAYEQVAATAATRKAQEEKLRAETEKFRVGKSTSLLVSQAQNDLLTSQIEEVRAVANYAKSLVNLYRLEGSLLERRGIDAPGRQPVEITRKPRPKSQLE